MLCICFIKKEISLILDNIQYHDFLPQALKSGQFKPMPPAEVVGEGLDTIQGAMDELKKGVSAKKIVVKL